MNQRVEKVREDIRRTKNKIAELQQYLKTLEIRETQISNEELIKVMRATAGKSGDVMEILYAFVKANETGAEAKPVVERNLQEENKETEEFNQTADDDKEGEDEE